MFGKLNTTLCIRYEYMMCSDITRGNWISRQKKLLSLINLLSLTSSLYHILAITLNKSICGENNRIKGILIDFKQTVFSKF